MDEKDKYIFNYNFKVQKERKEQIETKRRGKRKYVVCITNLFKTFRGLDIF